MSPNTLEAVLDVGSNTIRLLVAELVDGHLQTVLDRSEFARLGQGVDASGQLQAERMDAGIEAIQQLAREAANLGVHDLHAIATSAVRDAKNGNEFVSRVQSATGVPVRIISGAEEAEFTFRGATLGVSYAEGVIVCDLGGGSAELVYADAGGIRWSTSQPLGSGRLTERFIRHDPPHEAELKDVRGYVEECLLRQSVVSVPTAIFTGGTASHLGALTEESSQVAKLSLSDLEKTVGIATSIPTQEMVQKYNFKPERAQVLAAGAEALLTIALFYKVSLIAITQHGIREGVLLSL